MPRISNKDAQIRPPGNGADKEPQHDGSRAKAGQAVQAGQAGQPKQSGDASFAARFGRIILSHGISVLPTAIFHFQGKLDLSAQQMWFISNILSHKWDQELPYPSLNRMARAGGVDKTQLYDYKERLCRAGYLLVLPRRDSTGRRETNAYDFGPLFAKLETLISGESAEPNPIRAEGEPPEQIAAELNDHSFVARYGRVITSYGITAVPRALFTHGSQLGLTLQQVWFVCYILSYRWNTPLPYPSIKRMSARTGYSAVQLHNIKSELVQAGYLRLVPRYTEEGGQDTNAYDFSGLLDAIALVLDEGSQVDDEVPTTPIAEKLEEKAPRRGRKPAQKQIDGGARLSGVGGAYLLAPGGDKLSGVGGREYTGYGGGEFAGAGGGEFIEGDKPAPQGEVAHTSQGKVVRALHEIETNQIERNRKYDSNQHPQNFGLQPTDPGSKKTRIPGYSPYIAGVASDFSHELDDAAHELSNMKQAMNLWKGSGLDEQKFVELMQEARKLTRRYQGRPTWDAMGNKMAYFFTCLRGLVSHPEMEDM